MSSVATAGWKAAPEFLHGLIETLARRGRAALGRKVPRDTEHRDLETVGEALLSRRGEASGVTLAQSLLTSFGRADASERMRFLTSLVERFGPDRRVFALAIAACQEEGEIDLPRVEALHAAAEPRRQELIRRLNLAPGGTASLVGMREFLLSLLKENPHLQRVDDDFVHLFSSWFNRGFLVLKPIDWNTSANILEKIIRYEAVHAIQDWEDLRSRLEPGDRRCYAFFHPQLVDEPLIFVEVALTKDIPRAIGPLLEKSRQPIEAGEANTAVFYSISNTQRGLAGVSFGNFLIKQVVQDLAREFPNLKTFVTLSPVPGFRNWVIRELNCEMSAAIDDKTRNGIQDMENGINSEAARDATLSLAAFYFLKAKQPSGRPVDPVARFHLGNGAHLERLNFLADISAKGMKQSFGLMVNYLYSLDDIEANHEAFAEHGKIIASDDVKKMLRAGLPSQDLIPSKGKAEKRGPR